MMRTSGRRVCCDFTRAHNWLQWLNTIELCFFYIFFIVPRLNRSHFKCYLTKASFQRKKKHPNTRTHLKRSSSDKVTRTVGCLWLTDHVLWYAEI